MNIHRPGRPKLLLLAASFLGGLYCLLNAAGAELFCGTRGCEIYAEYGLFNISFYIYGFAGFLGIFLLTLWYPRRGTRPLLAVAVGLALVIDTLFLIYQSLLWPCSSCQVVAALIGLTAFLAVIGLKVPGRKLLAGLGLLWSVFFLCVGLAVVKEIAFRPWPLYGSAEAPVKVYFSPTCPACAEAARKILNDPEAATKSAFYPVAKNDADEARLATLLRQSEGAPDAASILGLFDGGEPFPPATLSLREKFLLFLNKMALSRADATSVPMIVSPYLFEARGAPNDLAPPIDTIFGTSPDRENESGCSAFTAASCED